jgi:MFS family permease
MFNFTGKTLVATITLTCSTAFLLFGYDQGVLSGIIGGDNQFGKHFDHPDANTQGLIVSVYHLGDVGGAIYMFFFGGYHGRKRAIIGTSVIMLIGAILQTASINRRMMYAARVITGVGNGANTATIPVWQAETSTAKGKSRYSSLWHVVLIQIERGKLIAIDSCLIIFGILIAYRIDYGFAHISGPAQWP